MRGSLIFVAAWLLLITTAWANPYGVTGMDWRPGGSMEALGMPSDCWAIHWGRLEATNVPQMPRPCKPGQKCRSNSYIVATESIQDPTAFASWIEENPGKVYVLGNEPDNPTADGDGMPPDEYAVMYHTYYAFISPLDPSARFAVGAVSGDAVPGDLEHDTGWWEQVLSIYVERYGVPMPVDIWNYHCYAPPYLRDVEDYMSIYVQPFCDWVKTVDGGRYAECEIWCTEFGIGFWHGALNMKWVEPWMQRLCLRLENSDVDRWFWFLGPWDSWSGKWQNTCLLYGDNTKTILGKTYSELANGWPNRSVAPKLDPEVLPAPELFFDDFNDGDMSDWIDKAGPWIPDGSGGYLCDNDGEASWWGTRTVQPFEYEDLTFEAKVKINSASDPKYWAGIKSRVGSMFGAPKENGYGWLAYLTQNGMLGLYSLPTGRVAAVPDAATATDAYHTLRVDVGGIPTQIDVYLDGEWRIHWYDMEGRFPRGFVGLEGGKSNCTFDDVVISRQTRMVPAAENGDFEAGDIADATPWLEWNAAGSNGVSCVYERSEGKTGRNGTVGLRISAKNAEPPFDGGIHRSIAGARPGNRYAVEAWVRWNAYGHSTPWAWVGIDPTGQIADPDATTIRWTKTPAAENQYVRVRTPVVTPEDQRISIWFRGGTDGLENCTIDVDDIVLEEERL